MIKIASTKDMDRDEWLKLRKQGIGGSDASVILGMNPWKSPMDLWLDKTGEFDEDNDNEAMYFGRALEDFVAKEFTLRTGLKVRRKNSMLRHADHPWMLANVDRMVVGEDSGLEAKTASIYSLDVWKEGVPEHYYPQVQHYMAVTGLKFWYVAALVGGQHFFIHKIFRNEDFITELIEKEEAFWKLVTEGTPPPMDGSEACSKLLNSLYPEGEKDKEVQLPLDAALLIRQYEEGKEEEDLAKTKKDEAANKLKEMLGDSERGFVHDRKVSWTNVSTKRFDSKRFEKEHPDLHGQYLNESLSRRFSIK